VVGGVLLPWFGPPVVKRVTPGRPEVAVRWEVAVRLEVVVASEVAVRPERDVPIRSWLTERPDVRPIRAAPVPLHRAEVAPAGLRSYFPVMAIAILGPVG